MCAHKDESAVMTRTKKRQKDGSLEKKVKKNGNKGRINTVAPLHGHEGK